MTKSLRCGRLVLMVVAIAATLGALAAPLAAQEPARPGASEQAPPPHANGASWRGQAAIDALGDRLPAVAARHGMTPGKLRKTFLADETLWIDPSDQLFYVEPTAEPAAEGAPAVEPAPFPLDETFTLHSKPGAQRVIHLDFDGQTVTGTGWNGRYGTGAIIDAEPYDTDGVAGFSDAEKEAIQDTWRRVAEDYAPFDVDVTTQDPGYAAINRADALDPTFGTRVVFDGGTPDLNCGCGGIAYVDVFDLTGPDHDYYQPAWVFQETPKVMAEAASHEVGHNLGLSHDGRSTTPAEAYYWGHGAWAPIMGVGYDRPVTQWSKGEYNLASEPEDDLALITANGLPVLADDHGNTNATATPLAGSPPQLSATGLISTRTDVDVFSFTAPGGQLVTLDATPAEVSPNLDIKLELFDGDGLPVTDADVASAYSTADVATGLDATIQQVLAEGTYYVRVDGVGQGTASTGYTDYASLGEYAVTATFGVCLADDVLEPNDLQSQAKLLVPGQSLSGVRCDDDWLLVPGMTGKTFTADLSSIDADLTVEFRDGSSILATATSSGATPASVSAAFSGGTDHYLRITGSTESRYNLTTAMAPICPENDPYELVLGDDQPSTATALTLPGQKDAILCSGDFNEGDFAKVTLVAGQPFEASMRYGGTGTFVLYMLNSGGSHVDDVVTSGPGVVSTTYTPPTAGVYYLWSYWTSGEVPYRLAVDQAAAPTVTDISPTSGPVGSDVVITGTSLHTASSVRFGADVPATSFTASPTSITATVPAGAIDGPITVENPTGTASSSQTFTVTPTNGNPTPVDDDYTVAEARTTSLSVLDNDSDPDGNVLTITGSTTGVNGGTVDCTSTATCDFTPAPGTATDQFTYTADDGNGSSAVATVDVTIDPCGDLAPGLDPTGLVTGESWVACSAADASAVTTTAPSQMTPVGGTVALLTTGEASLADPPNDSTDAGRDNLGQLNGAYDASIKQLDLTIPAGANCVSFQLVFGSEEYPEYVGSFNDAFLAELDATSWSVDPNTGAITAPNNFALDPEGNLISVNSVFFGDVVTDNGTEYDGTTPVLLVRTPVTPGEHSLFLSIFDAVDGALDSGAFVDDLQATTEAPGECTAGVVSTDVPPSVTLDGPTDGATVSGLVPLSATADEADVESVTFEVDGAVVATDTDPLDGWTGTWDASALEGPFTVTATAHDLGGQTGVDSASVTVVACPCASSPDETFNGQSADLVLDGDLGTWWQPTAGPDPFGTDPKTIQVRLPGLTELTSVRAQWFSEGYRFVDYTIEVSLDGITWTEVANITGNSSGDRTDALTPVEARHLRITGTAWTGVSGATYGPALRELTWN